MKKIMFNDKYGLTQAVLDGRKTMTRRIMNPQPSWVNGDGHVYNDSTTPKYKVGEVVAVAQSYASIIDELENPKSYCCMEAWEAGQGMVAEYIEWVGCPGFSNKMFVRADIMPHQIRITSVRIERLQGISDDDCLREGIYKQESRPGVRALYAFETVTDQHGATLAKRWYTSPREAFATLIDKISGKGTWDKNPYVIVYEFKLVK